MKQRSLSELRVAVAGAALPADALLEELAHDPRKGAQTLHRALQRRRDTAAARLEQSESMLQFERAAQSQGFSRVAGVDEAGRGPLAGPIVAAAVVLAGPVIGINDSKQLTCDEREAFYDTLTCGKHSIGIAVIAPSSIDQYGIQQANYQSMAQAVGQLSPSPDYLLIDGYKVPGLQPPQERIVKGDSRSQSIAAASVIAKVTRDRMMQAYDVTYPQYGFAVHKGYGTQVHLAAIAEHGPCPIHRMSFAPLRQMPETETLF